MHDRQREFDQLIEAHARIVSKVVRSWCRDPHDREDLTQEILAQLWRSFPSWDPSRKFSTWMYRVALNVAISCSRRSERRPTSAPRETVEELAAPSELDPVLLEQIQALYQAIDGLAQLDRALVLLYLEDHSHREIAEILGISETNVATKIGRLKKRMGNELNASATTRRDDDGDDDGAR